MKLYPVSVVLLLFAWFLAGCAPAVSQDDITELQATSQPVDIAFAPTAGIPAELPTSIPTISPAPLESASLSEFGRTLRLSYDPSLAASVTATTVPAVPVSPQVMFAESHPAYAAFQFEDYADGQLFQLPYPFQNAQVIIFQTRDFPGFGSEVPLNFASQQGALADLLQQGLAPDRCAQPLAGADQGLPFLPWLNSRQMFCAKPQEIAFQGGRGIRYLTHYTQGIGPVLEGLPFYTFQGLTGDGQFYISAVFPIQTGIFPADDPGCPKCSDPNYDPQPEWNATLVDQLARLNGLPDDQFQPSLAVLDAVVQSLKVE